MYPRTHTLSILMDLYNISDLSYGEKEDKLGDVFEDYSVSILESIELLEKAKKGILNPKNTDDIIFRSICEQYIGRYLDYIVKINATRDVSFRQTGGNPKTDVVASIILKNGSTIELPISVKHTSARHVSMAEFDVNTIVKEVGIDDLEVIRLLEKHQRDGSAKNFTPEEKQELTDRLDFYARDLVKWVISGTPHDTDDLRFPKLLLKFQLTREDDILDIDCYTVDQYVDYIMTDQHGHKRTGGFGTGLSWTYATGSKGKKIQFKG